MSTVADASSVPPVAAMNTPSEGQSFTTADAVGHVPIFRYLDRWVIERLADQTSIVACPRGPIFHEGDSGDGLYIIKSGTVKVTKSVTGDLPEAVLAFLHDGDSFGELQLIDGLPRSASVIAMESVECYLLGREPFSTILEQRPEVARSLLRPLAAMLRNTNQVGCQDYP